MPSLRPTSPGPDLPAAVLWDMDGTIVDTEPYWMAAERGVVEAAGGTWTHEQGLSLVGRSLLDSARIILEQTPVTGTPEELVDQIQGRVAALMREQVPWRPGARRLLGELRRAQVPCALVTMSYAVLARVLLDALPADTFATVVTGDQVERGKPHPEPYLVAATRLAIRPQHCVAIEDSPTGVASAVAAGVPVIAVPHLVPIEPRPGVTLVRTLDELTVEELWAAAREGVTGPPAFRPGKEAERAGAHAAPILEDSAGPSPRPGPAAGADAADAADRPWWRRAWEVITDPFDGDGSAEADQPDAVDGAARTAAASHPPDMLRLLGTTASPRPRRHGVPPPLGRPIQPWGRPERHFQVRWGEDNLSAIRALLQRPGVSVHQDGTRVYSGRAALVPDRERPQNARAVAVFVAGKHVGHLDRTRAQAYHREIVRATEQGGYVECSATIRVTPQGERVRLRIHLDLPRPGEVLPRNTPIVKPHAILPQGRRVQVSSAKVYHPALRGWARKDRPAPVLVELRMRARSNPEATPRFVEVLLEGTVVGILSLGQSKRLKSVIDRLQQQRLTPIARAWVTSSRQGPVLTLDLSSDDDALHDWLALHRRAGQPGSPREIAPRAHSIRNAEPPGRSAT